MSSSQFSKHIVGPMWHPVGPSRSSRVHQFSMLRKYQVEFQCWKYRLEWQAYPWQLRSCVYSQLELAMIPLSPSAETCQYLSLDILSLQKFRTSLGFSEGGKRKQPDPTQDICRCFSAPSTAKVRKHHLTSVQLRYKQCWWPSTVVSMCGIQFLLKLEVGSKIQEFSKTTFHHPMTLSHFKTWLYVLNTLYMGGFHDYFGCFSVHGLLKRTLTLYSQLPAVDATTGEGMDQIAILKRRFLFSQCQHSIIKDFKCEELGTYEYVWVLQHMAEWTRQEDR